MSIKVMAKLPYSVRQCGGVGKVRSSRSTIDIIVVKVSES